jgi:inorganic pyrophosphatase
MSNENNKENDKENNKENKREEDKEYVVDVFIEISKNTHIKYEFDEKKGVLVCNRVLHTPFNYFFNYGFIPHTLSPDNDPLDAVVLMDDALVPGCHIPCKILGCLETTDDEGFDPKMILCPCNKIDPTYFCLNDIHDISKHTLNRIRYFFSHYKDLENKTVKIGNFLNKGEAIAIFEQSCI